MIFESKTQLLALTFWTVISIALAEAVPVDPAKNHLLTYDEAVEVALHENADLLALRSQEESLKYQARQAVAPNEPNFSVTRNDIPSLSLTQSPAQSVYSVSWTLGFPGKALSSSAAITHQSEAVSAQARAQEVNIMTSLSNNYVSFVTNEALYKFLLDEQQKNKDLIKLIEKRFAASQASKVDLLNAQVATHQVAQAILENRNDHEVLLTQFRQIIRRPSDKSLFPQVPEKAVIPPVTQSFDELVPVMLRNNQAIAAANRTLDSTAALSTNAMLQALPDFELSAGVNTWLPTPAPNQGVTKDYTVGITVAVPIFFAFNELQGIHVARKNEDAAQYQLESQKLQAISALQTAYTSLKATLLDLDASEKLVVPAAKESFDLTLLTYGLGKADYLIVNQSRQAWHEASRDMLTKRQSAALLYNQLITQMGCDIAKTEGAHVCK